MDYEKLKRSLVDCVKEMGSQYQKTVDGANELMNSVKDSDKLKKALDNVEKTSESFLKEVEGVGADLKNAFVSGMEDRKAKKPDGEANVAGETDPSAVEDEPSKEESKVEDSPTSEKTM